MNYESLGYEAVCDILIRVQPQQEDEVIVYLEKIASVYHPTVYGIMKIPDPKNNIWLIVSLKDLKELDQTKDLIKRNKFVIELKTEVWTGIRNTPENIEILPKTSTRKPEMSSSQESKRKENTIDEIDSRIIEKLSRNSREAFGQIAQQIGTSLNTVAKRYKKLVENGIIKASIQIDPAKIGYQAMVNFNLAFASQNNTASVIKQLTAIKDNVLIVKTSGDYDLWVVVMIKDIGQFMATRDEIARIPGLTRLESRISPAEPPFPYPKEYITTF